MAASPEETQLILEEYKKEARAIEKQVIHISWYMRGGAPLQQAFQMTERQREVAVKFIEENIERSSKSGVMMF